MDTVVPLKDLGQFLTVSVEGLRLSRILHLHQLANVPLCRVAFSRAQDNPSGSKSE